MLKLIATQRFSTAAGETSIQQIKLIYQSYCQVLTLQILSPLNYLSMKKNDESIVHLTLRINKIKLTDVNVTSVP